MQDARSGPRKGQETHRRSAEIIEAAAHVFAEKGYHGATTQQIAERLGIRQASLYYYFKSKEAALELVCLKGAEGFYERAREIEVAGGSAIERLDALIHAHIAPLRDRAHYMKVFLGERQYLPKASRGKIARLARGLEQVFEHVIAEGVERGELRADTNPRLATLAILGMANAVPTWFVREGASVEAVARQLSSLALDGLSRQSGSAAPAEPENPITGTVDRS